MVFDKGYQSVEGQSSWLQLQKHPGFSVGPSNTSETQYYKLAHLLSNYEYQLDLEPSDALKCVCRIIGC